jgi:hypothetical protein
VLVWDGEDYLEVTVGERSTAVHDAGDTRFAVRVRVSALSAVLTAEAMCWVALPALIRFAEQLRVLEERRQGSATLESMSPNELRLEIRITDKAGHVAVAGQVGRWLGVGPESRIGRLSRSGYRSARPSCRHSSRSSALSAWPPKAKPGGSVQVRSRRGC